MATNLFAACRVKGDLVVKRVSLDGTIQDEVGGIFAQQRQDFFDKVDEEIAFDGKWKPDSNQLLKMDNVPDAQMLFETVTVNPTTVDELDISNLASEGIKALFTGEVTDGTERVLVQRFTLQQVLSRKNLFWASGNSFRRFEYPVLSLPSGLVFVIEGGYIKFRNYGILRPILDTQEVFREATEGEMQSFAGHFSWPAEHTGGFFEFADPVARKLVNESLTLGVFASFTPEDIRAAAAGVEDLDVVLEDGKLVPPSSRRDLKKLLHFLTEDLLISPLTGNQYLTNSKRPA